jgi:PAS domain S-box-containing protein
MAAAISAEYGDARSGLSDILIAGPSAAVTTSVGGRLAMEVTLARNRAKSRTRARKLHATGAKARVGRAGKSRADLERQLKACKREIANARERLIEATKQQTATFEMLRIISDTPLQSVLDAVAEHAARLCDSTNAEIYRLENNLLRLVASYGEIPVHIQAREGFPANRDRVIGRAICDRRSVHVHDLAAEDSEYPLGSSDAKRQGHRTTLATPLLRERTPIGVISFRRWEVRPFSDKQIALLETFADQAAIAIENVRLLEAEKQRTLALAHANRDLEKREAKVRRLVEANIIGIFIFDLEGRIVEANDAFLQMVGYDRDDFVTGRIRWTDLTPPEWRDRHTLATTELRRTGTVQPYEREYFRKDGSRVPALIGSAAFDDQRDQGVAFVLDLSERKRAEAAARESEQKLREMQAELAHANRVATIGQLTASIVHEVKQPIAATVTGAQAAQRWLNMQPANLAEVDDLLLRIVRDGKRAGDIIDGMRDQIKKTQARKEPLNINAAIREVIELARGETRKNGISMQTDLDESIQLLEGDRVQLQQVILNLVMNAVEAMNATSEGARELLISTRKSEPDVVLVAVRDSGPGLATETLDRLFDAFYTTKPGGLGLGLSICRSIIETHGGRLSAKANMPRGATFEFSLPGYADVANQPVVIGAT